MPVVDTARPLAEDVRSFFTLDPRFIDDPYPLYARLRSEAPVFRDTERVLVSRHDDVRLLLNSPQILQGLAVRGSRARSAAERLDDQGRVELAEMFGFLEQRLGGTNGEHHTRLRRLAQSAFTPRMVARMEEQIAAIADDLIGTFAGDTDPVELISRYSYHLPLIVICEMLDIPPEARDDLRIWANTLGYFVGADWTDRELVARSHDNVFKLRNYLTELFDSRRGGSSSDLLTALINAESDGDRFTEEELVAMITQFVFAGHETSTMFLGNALVSLLGAYRSQWDELCADPSLIPPAVEELLRHGSPTHNIDKLAAEDFELGGIEIKQWDTVNLMLASANHDERAYEHPEVLDIHRADTHHLSLGFGPHFCLGASLARLEATVSLRAFTGRFPQMRLVTDTIEWRRTHMNRGPEQLPVELGPQRPTS